MITIKEVLNLIQLYDTNLTKIRIGHQYDGGYILLDEICKNIKTVYSFGVDYDASFDSDYSLRYGAHIRMFDHTVDGIPYNGWGGADAKINADFLKKGIWFETTENMDTLENYVNKYGEMNTRKILKMDVEGAEWDSISKCPDSVLKSFDIICVEFHDFQLLSSGDAMNHQGTVIQRKGPNQRDIDIRYETLKKLTNNFYIFHAHANNGFPIQVVDGINVAPIVEMSLVRKDLVKATPVDWCYTEHDATNNHNLPEIMLNFWPYVRSNS